MASDPGPTERIAGRTPGRRRGPTGAGIPLQARAHRATRWSTPSPMRAAVAAPAGGAAAAEPSTCDGATPLRRDHRAGLQAIVAFGEKAREALTAVGHQPRCAGRSRCPHPSSPTTPQVCSTMARQAVDRPARHRHPRSRTATPRGPNYGTEFAETRLRRHPASRSALRHAALVRRRRLGSQRPSRGTTTPSSVPARDPLHTLVWQAPRDQP